MGVFGQYARAVEYLYKAIEQTSFSADHCSYPLLYLMRHSIEVGLKANIQCVVQEGQNVSGQQAGNTHDLSKLHRKFVSLVEEQGIMDHDTLTFFQAECQCMESLIKLMPSASSFRYTEDQNGATVFGTQVLDIAAMKSMFDRTHTILAYTPAVLFGP